MSDLPSSSDDYTVTNATELTAAVCNAIFNSIGARLRALEAVEASFQSLIDLGTSQALASIAANVEPELVAARAALTQLQVDTALAEDAVAAILAGSIPLSSVTGLSAALASKATSEDVAAALAALVGSAPATLDTLAEIAAALNDDASAVSSILAQITSSAILAKLVTVDGSGSGLDADLVHGTTPGTTGLALLAAAAQADGRTALALGSAAVLDAATTGANTLVQRSPAGVIVDPVWDLVVEDQKASGTNGGAATGGTWNARDLNTVVVDRIGVTLASNVVTIPAGTYWIVFEAPAYYVSGHRTRLYSVTGAAPIAYGTTEYTAVNPGVMTRSRGGILVTFATETQIRVDHWTSGGGANVYLGPAAAAGVTEIYSRLCAKRVA